MRQWYTDAFIPAVPDLPLCISSTRPNVVHKLGYAFIDRRVGEIVGSALRVSGGDKEAALVLPKCPEPVVDVGGVVGAGFRGELQVGADEGGSEFSDEFLDGVGGVAPALLA